MDLGGVKGQNPSCHLRLEGFQDIIALYICFCVVFACAMQGPIDLVRHARGQLSRLLVLVVGGQGGPRRGSKP